MADFFGGNPTQATQTVGVDPQALELQRKRQLANLLTQQALTQPPQGQMVSGHYVAPSFTQNLANLYGLYKGQQMQGQADKEQVALAKQLRDQNAKEAYDIISTMRGAPEYVPQGQTLRDDEGNLTYGAREAVAPNLELALAKAYGSQGTAGQALAPVIAKQLMKEPKWEKAELTDPRTGNTRQGWVDINSPNPESTFRQGGEKPGISPENVMKGKFEGWYNPSLVLPTGGVSTGGVIQPTGGAMQPTGGQMTPTGMTQAPMPGMSPQAAIEANKQVYVDKAKRQAEYAEKAPGAIEFMNQTIQNINDLIGDAKVVNGKIVHGTKAPHAGFESAVGISAAPLSGFIPGTPTTDFKERFNQIGGQAFLQAFDTLRGAGQITEVEGAKATKALNRMSLAQSEVEFVKAAREFEEFVNKGMELARKRAGIATPTTGWRVKQSGG